MSNLRHVMHWAALSTWDIRLHRRMRSKSKAAHAVKIDEDTSVLLLAMRSAVDFVC